jgi:hypothetical protein
VTLFVIRHRRLHKFAHRLLDVRAARYCGICTSVSRHLRADPNFLKALNEGLADLDARRVARVRP